MGKKRWIDQVKAFCKATAKKYKIISTRFPENNENSRKKTSRASFDFAQKRDYLVKITRKIPLRSVLSLFIDLPPHSQ